MPGTTHPTQNSAKVVEIVQIKLSHLNNGAHFQFVKNVSDRVTTETKIKENPVGLAAVNALTAALAEEDRCLQLSQKSLLTDEITTADKERDTLFSGYRTAVKGFLQMPVPALAKAARELWQHLVDYAIDPKMQLERETGLLTNLCGDLAGKYATQVQQLGLKPYADALKTANERVEALLVQRTTDHSTKVVGALRTARLASDDAIHHLTKVVNALATLGNRADFMPFVDFMNTLIKRYKEQAMATPTQADREKRMAEYDAMLKKGFAALEEHLKLEKGSLSFTGKTEGRGSKRHYQLAIKGQTEPDGQPKTMWVGVNKDGSLFPFEKTTTTKTTTTKPAVGPKPGGGL